MKKLLLIPTVIVLFVGGYFLVPLLAYQNLINEGSSLADNQCLKVNPFIIERKNSYIKSIQALKDNDYKEYEKQTEKYFAASRKFVTEQSTWLNSQEKYMDRWDFQQFSPSYIKTASRYQYDSRKADMESTTLLIESYEVSQLNKSLADEIAHKSVEKVKIRNEAEKKYEEIWDNPGKMDWRTRFIRVPKTTCPEENLNFPDVDDFLNPGIAPADPDAPLS